MYSRKPQNEVAQQSITSTSQSMLAKDQSDEKRTWRERLYTTLKEPGSALQIVIAAAIAIAIEIPGRLWLRALRATVLPLIVCVIILAMQTFKQMAKDGAKLVRWTICWYVDTTILAVVHSMILVDLVWAPLMVVPDSGSLLVAPSDQENINERASNAPHDIIVSVFNSFIPNNVVNALATDSLLAVLVSAIVVGLLIKGGNSSILRVVREIGKIISTIIAFLIKMAPIGVFFLTLSNLLTLDIADIGLNLVILIGGSITGMFIHLFIVLPLLFFAFTRSNPYSYWVKNSPAWITGWGTASSAATLPVTIRCLEASKIPTIIVKFTAPLGCMINMDGTAIYFPMVVVFLAATQGIALNAGDYALIVLLSTLSSIATTPIPSSSLVLTVMIASSVGISITGVYAVVVAIGWFIDRFRTMTNVSGNLYAAKIFEKVTGITDKDEADRETTHRIERDMADAEKGMPVRV